jgi:hypothetical protein
MAIKIKIKSKRKKTAKTKLSKPVKAKKTRKDTTKTAKTLKKSSKLGMSRPSPAPFGAVVSGTDPCTCGDAPEEHGHDAAHPGSTACTVKGCGCIAYEADHDADETATNH